MRFVRFILAEVEDEAFDLVVSSEVVEHVNNPSEFVKELVQKIRVRDM